MTKAGTWLRPGMALAGAAALLAGAAALLALPAGAAGAATQAAASPAPARSVMVLLDVNTSLGAAGLTAEEQAAQAYVANLPAHVKVGLVTFDDRSQTVLFPTAHRARFTAKLTATRLGAGATSLGIGTAVPAAEAILDRLGIASSSRLLVLSDAEMLTGPAPSVTIPADVVGWYYENDDNLPVLRALATASGGHIANPARTATLAAAFSALPRAPASAKNPTAKPAPPRMAQASFPAASAGGLALPVVLALVFAALLVVALLVLGALRGGGDRAKLALAQIERYGARHTPAVAAKPEGKVADAAVGWAQRVLRSSNQEPRLAYRLDLAGSRQKPAEWALLGFCATVAVVALLTVLTNVIIGVLAGGLAGGLGMHFLLNIRIARRRRAFSDQLPDVLQLIAGSLQAGFSLPQALDGVVREGTQPAAGEFSRALAEARVGLDLEVALDGVASRMDSIDLKWTVMAIRIQREVGGNLAEVLGNTVATMRERGYLRRHVKALSAEGRLSAYILTALPIAVAGWMFFTARTYMHPLYTTLTGWFMVGGALALFAIGVFWLRALIKVEV